MSVIKRLCWLVGFALPLLALRADEPAKSKPKERPTIEARFVDGSALRLSLRDEEVEIVSPYGRLRVPTAEIRRIELATRTPPELAERIAVWIADLENQQFQVRDAATSELNKVRVQAYHALVSASKHKDPET